MIVYFSYLTKKFIEAKCSGKLEKYVKPGSNELGYITDFIYVSAIQINEDLIVKGFLAEFEVKSGDYIVLEDNANIDEDLVIVPKEVFERFYEINPK